MLEEVGEKKRKEE